MWCLTCGTASAQFTFTEKSATPFPGVSFSSIAFADVDGKNGPDVLITGLITDNQATAKLYLNDGSGGFTLKATLFAGVSSGSAFADVDGKNGPDVLITGYTGSERIAKLYLNDGSGGFTLKATPFPGVSGSSIAFADVDGKNGPDVLITGNDGSKAISSLYLNNGSGGFSLKATPSPGVDYSSIAFADVDGKNGPDVLI
ncbi:MAG: VCBS repeat-containing protein, partial [Ekhidna sp.]|nr:VCBS repeat-containing protein [Ekhidna sp.]